MALLSTPVLPTDNATASEYNNLRTDLILHTHDGVDTPLASGIGTQNLLVNPGFEVWQRGGGPFSGGGVYTADRWSTVLAGSTISVSRSAGNADAGSVFCAQVDYTQAGTGRLIQQLEDYGQLRGRTAAFAIRVKAGVAAMARPYLWDSVNGFRFGAYHTGSGAYQTLSIVAPIAAAATGVQVGVVFEASGTAWLDSATLVASSAPAAYQPLHPADDLLRCQRYYYELGGLDTNENVLPMQCYSTTQAQGPFRFPVEMAIPPTITISAIGDWRLTSSTLGAIVCSALAGASPTRRGCAITASVASGLVAGNASILFANATLAARIKFESNP